MSGQAPGSVRGRARLPPAPPCRVTPGRRLGTVDRQPSPFPSVYTFGDFIRQLNQPAAKKKLDGELPENRGCVFHAVVSAPSGDRLDHEVWGSVAQDYIKSMGFDGSDGKAGCRWAAFHHGQSSNDNDHIHIVVQMIREDGTWASNYRSLQRSQEARRAIEKKYGFIAAEEAARQRDWPAYSMVDAQRATTVDQDGKRVLAETEVEKLRRLMLGAATQAQSESDYVKALWRAGVLTRPRFAAGTTDVVVGYSVAVRPEAGKKPFWHPAGKVHKSLTITNVRARYVDSPEAAFEASATWDTYNAARLRAVVPPRRGCEGCGKSLLCPHLDHYWPLGGWKTSGGQGDRPLKPGGSP